MPHAPDSYPHDEPSTYQLFIELSPSQQRIVTERADQGGHTPLRDIILEALDPEPGLPIDQVAINARARAMRAFLHPPRGDWALAYITRQLTEVWDQAYASGKADGQEEAEGA